MKDCVSSASGSSAKARNSEITGLIITSPEPREIVVNGRAYCLKNGENVLI